MTSIDLRSELVSRSRSPRVIQTTLLVGGMISSLLYIALDLTAAALYPGYSIRDQVISELSATGAPTTHLWSAISPAYGILFIGFAIGVIRAAGDNRALRNTGALLLTMAAAGVFWAFVPMHQRGTELTWQDTGHQLLGAVSLVLILSFTWTGAFTLGRRFRWYSLLTMVIVFVTGVPLFLWTDRVAAAQPTPWLGATERLMMYSFLVWIIVLAVALLRRDGKAPVRAA